MIYRLIKIFAILIFFIISFNPHAYSRNKGGQQKELRLMFNSFIFNGNLEYAVKTAEIGVKKYPKSLFWRRNLAKVLVWTGKARSAVSQYLFIYEKTKDKKLRDQLIDMTLDNYQLDTAIRLLKEKMKESGFQNEEDLKDLIYMMNENSDPTDTLEFLSTIYNKNHKEQVLRQALALAIQAGEIESADAIVKIMAKKESLSIESVNLISYYYFLRRDPDKAFEILTRVSDETSKNIDYYKKISDLGWYVGEYEKASDASYILIKKDAGREVDYQRVIQVKRFSKPDIAYSVAVKGLEKYQKRSFFYSAAYILMDKNQIFRLFDVLQVLPAEMRKNLEKEASFFLIMASYHESTHRLDLAKEDLFNAEKIEPDNQSILISIIWFMMNNKMDYDLGNFLFKVEKMDGKKKELLTVLSSANLYLQNIDRAYSHIREIEKRGQSDTSSNLILSYILQVKLREGEYYNTAHEIYNIFNNEIQNNPDLLTKKDFLDEYLSLAIQMMHPDEFKTLLERSRSVLGEKRFLELSLIFALQNNSYEMAGKIASQLQEIDGWQILSMALHQHDPEKIKDSIEKYAMTLPLRDRVDGAMKIKSYSKAESFVFEGLEKNQEDYLIYYQMKQTFEETADRLDVETDFISKDSIDNRQIKVKNKNHLCKGWYLEEDVKIKSFKVKKEDLYQNFDSLNHFMGIGLRKIFDRGSIFTGFELMNKKRSSIGEEISFEYDIFKRMNINIGLLRNSEATESTYIEAAGKKDSISAGLTFRLLPSTNTSILVTKENFKSDDDENIGNSLKLRADSYTVLRTGYPDLNLNFFMESGLFSENDGAKGVIDEIRPFTGDVLSADYINLGFGLYYGYQNKDTFVRDWRPYFGITPYYEFKGQKYNLGFDAGIGGKLFFQDHLKIGMEYKPAIYATDENSMTIYFGFSYLY